jgi:DNA-binding transcriptional ArsR family regulator
MIVYYLRMNADTEVWRGVQPDAEQVDLAVEMFRMLSDATRIRLLWALLDGELPVNDLAATVGKPAAAVSQHLAKLRMSRFVQTRRHGTQVFYRVENDHVRQLVQDAVHNAEHAGPGVPRHHRGEQKVVGLGEAADQATAEPS